MTDMIRIAIAVDSTFMIPAWEHAMLSTVQTQGFAEIICLVKTKNRKPGAGQIGFRLFKKFENRWFRSMPDAASAFDVREDFSLPIISDDALLSLKDLNIDLIYSSASTDADRLSGFAKYGSWSISFGTGKYSSSVPPAFWETMNDEPVIGARLEISMHDEAGERIVYEGSTTTVPYSVKNSFNSIAWKASSFLLYRLRELALTGHASFFSKYSVKKTNVETGPVKKSLGVPGNLALPWLFTRNILRYLRYKIKTRFEKKCFTLLFARQSFQFDIPLSAFEAVKLPTGKFWADPFVMQHDKKDFIFFEEFDYQKDKGHISVVQVDSHGKISEAIPVLEKAYHLSYPFLFQHGQEQYMIPETSANRNVELYKAEAFPYKWKFVANILENIELIDATLVHYNEKWWLFGCSPLNSFTSSNDQLFLYFSDNLFSGKWISHPQNPIVTDIGNCRPAGAVFENSGNLYRPAQNNASRQYGYAIRINKILRMDETTYMEEVFSELLPDKSNNLQAIHTINFSERITVIDGIPQKKQ